MQCDLSESYRGWGIKIVFFFSLLKDVLPNQIIESLSTSFRFFFCENETLFFRVYTYLIKLHIFYFGLLFFVIIRARD